MNDSDFLYCSCQHARMDHRDRSTGWDRCRYPGCDCPKWVDVDWDSAAESPPGCSCPMVFGEVGSRIAYVEECALHGKGAART